MMIHRLVLTCFAFSLCLLTVTAAHAESVRIRASASTRVTSDGETTHVEEREEVQTTVNGETRTQTRTESKNVEDGSAAASASVHVSHMCRSLAGDDRVECVDELRTEENGKVTTNTGSHVKTGWWDAWNSRLLTLWMFDRRVDQQTDVASAQDEDKGSTLLERVHSRMVRRVCSKVQDADDREECLQDALGSDMSSVRGALRAWIDLVYNN